MPSRHPRYRSMLLRSRRDDGLGLAEMLVAIAVVVVVLLSAGAAFVRMGQAQRSAEAADRGTQMIQDELETIRKLPYTLVGCYQDDAICPPKAATTSPANDSNGEVIVSLGSTRPTAVSSGGAPVGVKDDVRVGNNTYQVTTVVTWAGVKDLIVGYPANLSLAPYAAKRVTVTASWALGSKTQKVTRQWLRSPTTSEAVPPAAGTDSLSRCPEESPICSISITQGQVFEPYSGVQVARPIEFTVRMSFPASSGTVTIGGTTTDLILTDPKTLTHVIGIGPPISGVRPGRNTVTISVHTSAGDKAVDKVVTWGLPISAAYHLSTPTFVADAARTLANGNPTTGLEAPTTSFCVKNTDKTLWRYTAVIVDEVNVDDKDVNPGHANTPPQLQVTGISPEGSSLTTDLIAWPTGMLAGYDRLTGYVGPSSSASGAVNTRRWSYGFQPGFAFSGATGATGAKSTVTISGDRAGDGAAASATITILIKQAATASACTLL